MSSKDLVDLAERIKRLTPDQKLQTAAGIMKQAKGPDDVRTAIRIAHMGADEAELALRLGQMPTRGRG